MEAGADNLAALMERPNQLCGAGDRGAILGTGPRGRWDLRVPSRVHTPYAYEPPFALLATGRLGLLHVVPPLSEREDRPSFKRPSVPVLGWFSVSSRPSTKTRGTLARPPSRFPFVVEKGAWLSAADRIPT